MCIKNLATNRIRLYKMFETSSRWRQYQLWFKDGGRTRAQRTCLRATAVKRNWRKAHTGTSITTVRSERHLNINSFVWLFFLRCSSVGALISKILKNNSLFLSSSPLCWLMFPKCQLWLQKHQLFFNNLFRMILHIFYCYNSGRIKINVFIELPVK